MEPIAVILIALAGTAVFMFLAAAVIFLISGLIFTLSKCCGILVRWISDSVAHIRPFQVMKITIMATYFCRETTTPIEAQSESAEKICAPQSSVKVNKGGLDQIIVNTYADDLLDRPRC